MAARLTVATVECVSRITSDPGLDQRATARVLVDKGRNVVAGKGDGASDLVGSRTGSSQGKTHMKPPMTMS